MDTKLRRFRTHILTKGVAFILAVIIITAAAMQIPLARSTGINDDCIFQKDFLKSNYFRDFRDSTLHQFIYNIESLPDNDNTLQFLYYCKVGNSIKTNISEYMNAVNNNNILNNNDAIYKFFIQNKKAFYFTASDESGYGNWIDGNTSQGIEPYEVNSKVNAYVAFPEKYLTIKQKEYENLRAIYLKYIITGIILAALGIVPILYLIYAVGRRHEDDKIHLTAIDKIYSDIFIVAFLCFSGSIMQAIWDSIFYYSNDNLILRGCTFAFFVSITLFVILYIVRKAKAGVLIKHSLLYKLFRFCYRIGRDIYQYLFYGDLFQTVSQTKTLYYRQLITCVVACISFLLALFFAVAHTALFLFPTIVFGLILYWYVKGNAMIYKNIDKGIEESLEERMKSERMKVALITNVSHDLKTPLTSIVSYVDLLSKEEGLSEAAKDYIQILQNKSERLTNIVTDLFELAKSTSGNVKLDEENLDLKKLLEQTLADMEDKIKESALQFKTKLPEVPVIICSDGKKLYRVFQNIIDNALKYSLKNTRVYIDLEILDQKAIVTVKNIASYEMNFTEEEILQRFYRGDQSRTTEGSGLGLSIAESFTNNCGGKLEVAIDGDVFKVMITFDLNEDSTNIV